MVKCVWKTIKVAVAVAAAATATLDISYLIDYNSFFLDKWDCMNANVHTRTRLDKKGFFVI